MIVREYLSADFPQVEKLWKETCIFTEERGDPTAIIHRCNSLGGKFLIMEDTESNVIAGTSWMTFDGRHIHLHHFAIKPSYQKKGLGRHLAMESLNFAHNLGCPMKLEVHHKNNSAIHLYHSLGFTAFDDYCVFMILDPGEALASKNDMNAT